MTYLDKNGDKNILDELVVTKFEILPPLLNIITRNPNINQSNLRKESKLSGGKIYVSVKALKIMKLVKIWRAEGLPVYFTINTGQDIHLICEKINVKKVIARLKELEDVKNIIINYPSSGARLTNKHLF